MKTTSASRVLRILVPAVILFLMSAPMAMAKESDPLGEGRERILNGHGFLPSFYVASPFVSSSFHTHVGGGVASDLKTPFNDLEGNELYVLEGDLFFASLGLSYQQKLGEKFCVGAKFSALIRTGTNAESFLTEGADVNRDAGLWGQYRLMRTEKSQLTVGLDWSYNQVIYFTPRKFAEHIADGGSLDDAPLVLNSKIWTSRVTANWARGLSPVFGVRVNAEFGLYEVPETEGVSKGSHRLGILGEMDLQHTGIKIPVGVTLGYTQNLPDDDPFTGLSGALLGFWYTGKTDFVVGVELGAMKMPVANQVEDEVNTMFGIFTIRYFF